MYIRPSRVLRVAIIATALVASGARADAEPPARQASDCVAAVRDHAMRAVFALSLTLDENTGLPEDQYVQIHGALADWQAISSSRSLAACAASTPGFDRWWNYWVHRFAETVVRRARQRMEELCAPQVRSYLRRRGELANMALKRSNLVGARDLADETAIVLRSRDIFRTCPSTRADVAHTLDVALPALYGQVELPGVLRDLAATYLGARRPLQAAIADLHGPADKVAQATELLASVEGRAAMARSLAACEQRAAAARQLGADDETVVPMSDGVQLRLADVADWCRAAANSLPATLAQLESRVQTRDRLERVRWEHYNIDGWGMRQVYDRLGRPDRIQRHNGRTEWRYLADTCTSYVFGDHGRQLSRSTRPCPGRIAAAARRPRAQ